MDETISGAGNAGQFSFADLFTVNNTLWPVQRKQEIVPHIDIQVPASQIVGMRVIQEVIG